ncbi:hypothetical protein D3C78_1547130 [compost metagenome]
MPVNFRYHYLGLLSKLLSHPFTIIAFVSQVQLMIKRGCQRSYHLTWPIAGQRRALLFHGFRQIGQQAQIGVNGFCQTGA